MTTETLSSLNTNTLIGNTRHRDTAWHYRAEEQGDECNHYPGAIPPGDVSRRLFGWRALSLPDAVERPADILTMTHRGADGMPARWVQIDGRQAIVRSDEDDGHVLGLFTDAYEPHQYTEYLLTAVGNILDDSLSISSAGVLRDGAVAWVEVSVPESITTPEGVEFRPNLLATTTLDGSLATTYKRTVTDVVCDNTRAAALRARGPVGGDRSRGPPGGQHLRAPPQPDDDGPSGPQHAPRRHRSLRAPRPPGVGRAAAVPRMMR